MKNNLRLIVNNEEVIRTPKRGVLALVVDNTSSSREEQQIESETTLCREKLMARLQELKAEYMKKVGLI